MPLYEEFAFNEAARNPLFWIEDFTSTLDFYCPECGQHSVFAASENLTLSTGPYSNYVFYLRLFCSRNKSHQALFIFWAHKGVLQKIGQTPSMADLALPDLRKYQKVLGSERFKELSRAIGLVTHGVGVGAFVYLRRIFESLIEEVHVKAKADAGWDGNPP